MAKRKRRAFEGSLMLRSGRVDVAACRSDRRFHDALFVGRHIGELHLDTALAFRIPVGRPHLHARSPHPAVRVTSRRDSNGPAVMLTRDRAAW